MPKELTSEEKITVASYDAIAPQWAAAHSDLNFWQQELRVFQKYLPYGDIIEIGAGGGRDAKILAATGYSYFGIEPSKLIKEARKNNPQLRFAQQSVYDLNSTEAFDGFWASAVLLHIPKSRINEALSSIHQVIRKDGIGFISIKQGIGEGILTEEEFKQTINRYFAYYSTEEFMRILYQGGFDVLESQTKPLSPKTTWLNFFVKVQK